VDIWSCCHEVGQMRTFIISGIAGGIGSLLANRFDDGASRVIGLYRNAKPQVERSGGNYHVDVSDWTATSGFINEHLAELEEVVLLACAGTNYNSYAHKADHAVWEETIKNNLIGAFNIASACLPIMRHQGYGRIVFFSSVVAKNPTPGVSAYAASKAGLWGLTKSLAAENASMGITTNCLNLGYMELGMIKDVPEKFSGKILGNIPSGRFGDAESIISSIDFLIKASYVNGASIDINGALA
jgi:NAD(P)-dependent dehydrogenase (short-subunit alcohol dehydrogenase family)